MTDRTRPRQLQEEPSSTRSLGCPAVFRRAAAASLAVVALVGFSSCAGTVIDQEKLEATVQDSLESSVHEKIRNVDCPSDQSVDPGATFTCEVIFSDDRREIATLKIRNEDADLSIVGIEATK
jgi:Domain of unknown function (DUF4333)